MKRNKVKNMMLNQDMTPNFKIELKKFRRKKIHELPSN